MKSQSIQSTKMNLINSLSNLCIELIFQHVFTLNMKDLMHDLAKYNLVSAVEKAALSGLICTCKNTRWIGTYGRPGWGVIAIRYGVNNDRLFAFYECDCIGHEVLVDGYFNCETMQWHVARFYHNHMLQSEPITTFDQLNENQDLASTFRNQVVFFIKFTLEKCLRPSIVDAESHVSQWNPAHVDKIKDWGRALFANQVINPTFSIK